MQRVAVLVVSACVLTILAISGHQVFAQREEGQEPIKVVTKEIEPFVFVNGELVGGFSIDLWEALAEEAGLEFEYLIVNTVQEQLEAVETNQADAAVGAISMTKEREETVDFSHSYFLSGLGILTYLNPDINLRVAIQAALSPTVLQLLAILVLAAVAAAHVIWLIERRRNPDFPPTYLRGVWEGLWWSTVTVTSVGYGDKVPIGRLGRLFGMLWMFAGIFLIAYFTAGAASELTYQRLHGTIRSPEDLRGKLVVTVAGSTADEWLRDQQITHSTVETIEDAYALLDNGIVQAVVFDYPVLLYHVLQNPEKRYSVPTEAFSTEDYGFAFPADSSLREVINRELLGLVEDGTYEQIHTKWFGSFNE